MELVLNDDNLIGRLPRQFGGGLSYFIIHKIWWLRRMLSLLTPSNIFIKSNCFLLVFFLTYNSSYRNCRWQPTLMGRMYPWPYTAVARKLLVVSSKLCQVSIGSPRNYLLNINKKSTLLRKRDANEHLGHSMVSGRPRKPSCKGCWSFSLFF